MHVVATAGHVDHGKSALVRALTGMEPDRWAEERRRGMTIDLGFAWLRLPSGSQLAFVDVPGHERFVPNMLAGVGPVPAVLFVVAADGGWMPQSAEHLAAIDALGIRHGLLAVTRADLADPEPALREATGRIARSSLGVVPAVAVSAVTGAGLAELLGALGKLVAALPPSDPKAAVRLWVDRAFSSKGSGTVATGTLPAGTIAVGETLAVTPSLRPVRVRGLQTLKAPTDRVSGVARVAVNLRGLDAGALARGMALVTPGAWTLTSVVDVRLGAPGVAGATWPAMPDLPAPPREVTVHAGSARTPARVRMLAGPIVRLTLTQALPLHVGDRLLLRVPGAAGRVWESRNRPDASAWPPLIGASVLDVAAPALTGRGAAAAAGAALASWPPAPSAADLLRRHGLLRAGAMRAMGVRDLPPPVVRDWLADPGYLAGLRDRLVAAVRRHAAADPLAVGLPIETARNLLGVPDRHLVEALATAPGVPLSASPGGDPLEPLLSASPGGTLLLPGDTPGPHGLEPPLTYTDGVIRMGTAGGKTAGSATPSDEGLPEPLLAAVTAVRRDLAATPFLAPEVDRLRELGLGPKAIAAAARAGLLLRVSDQVVLGPGADMAAAAVLAGLAQPFTTAQARQALRTTRRVAIPLLEYLDRAGITRRLPDDRRVLASSPPVSGRGGAAR